MNNREAMRIKNKFVEDTCIYNSLRNNLYGRVVDINCFMNILESSSFKHTVLSVSGPWGVGKTYFVKQLCYIMKCKNQFKKDYKDSFKYLGINDFIFDYIPCYFNAWEYNESNLDPIFSILFILQEQTKVKLEESILKKLYNLLALFSVTVNWFCDSKIGIRLDFDAVKKRAIFGEYKTREKIKDLIDDYIGKISKGKKIVIFVDELDRCTFNYIYTFIERVEHYFTNDYLTIVYSMNRSVVSNMFNEKFKSNVKDSEDYFTRIIHMDYILNNGTPKLLKNGNSTFIHKEFSSIYNLTSREYMILKSIFKKLDYTRSNLDYAIFKLYTTPLIYMRYKDIELYTNILRDISGDFIGDWLIKHKGLFEEYKIILEQLYNCEYSSNYDNVKDENIENVSEIVLLDVYKRVFTVVYFGNIISNNECYSFIKDTTRQLFRKDIVTIGDIK